MAFIYAGARNVLVLDPDLQKITPDKTHDMDERAEMALSAWMTRCWTFQEARLARKLAFLLNDDRIYFPHEESKKYRRDGFIASFGGRSDLKDLLEMQSSLLFTDLEPMMDPVGSDFSRFVNVWNALAYRSTTKQEDLHGIIAIMADLHCEDIMYSSLGERPLAE